MRKIHVVIILATVIAAAFIGICRVFETPFAEATIDYFSFFAGAFLMVEGIWHIATARKTPFFNQILRAFRAIIGMEVLTIHILQFISL